MQYFSWSFKNFLGFFWAWKFCPRGWDLRWARTLHFMLLTKAWNFEIQNSKTLKNPKTLLRSLEFVIHQNLEHDAITVSNLVRNWNILIQISYSCRNVANLGVLQICSNVSTFKSAKTYKSRRVLVSPKTVYSGISKIIL